MKTRRLFAVALATVFGGALLAQTNMSTLTDADGNLPTGITVLDAATDWRLNEKVYVPDGGELHIEAGTVIKATVGSGLQAPAIIVTRGGKIYAMGSKEAPIIMTTVEDNLDGTYPILTQGKWGGLLVLGRAYNNIKAADEFGIFDGEATIEGLDVPDDRHHYGQDRWETDDPDAPASVTDTDPNTTPNAGDLKTGGDFDQNDNSGVIKYISIRHGGAIIGDANEINGLTLGSVGKGTVLEHIEVISNQDDGIEFFGGNVDIKYATIMFCDDDYIDWDLGYTGRGQFIYGVQLPEGAGGAYSREGDHGLEIDGDDDDRYTGDPSPEYFSDPVFYNVTMIGNQGTDPGVEAKERTNGEISNSIIANFAVGVGLASEGDRPSDAYENFLAGTLKFKNNTFVGNTIYLGVAEKHGTGNRIDPIPQSTIDAFNADGNLEDNNLIDFTMQMAADADNTVSDAVDPVPAAGTAASDLAPPVDDFFDAAPYRGAFVPGEVPWTSGWTYANELGMDNGLNTVNCATDVDGDGDTDVDDLREVNTAYDSSCLQ